MTSILTPYLADAMVRVTEITAIASATEVGRGDEKKADQAAVDAMRTAFNAIDFQGRVVIGEGERDEAPMLFIGEEVGTGTGPEIDIALDPLEGTTLTAKAMANALAVLAIAPRVGCSMRRTPIWTSWPSAQAFQMAWSTWMRAQPTMCVPSPRQKASAPLTSRPASSTGHAIATSLKVFAQPGPGSK